MLPWFVGMEANNPRFFTTCPPYFNFMVIFRNAIFYRNAIGNLFMPKNWAKNVGTETNKFRVFIAYSPYFRLRKIFRKNIFIETPARD